MIIYLANKSTVLSNADVLAALPGFQHYVSQVNKAWSHSSVTLKFAVTTPPVNSWQIIILDDSDQAGALGWHDFTPGGKPIAKVFARTDLQYGYNWQVTLTHELAEMIVDPWIVELFQTSNTQFYAKEVGDPVEADVYAADYTIPASGVVVKLSDFVYPAWFIPGAPGPYSQGRHATAPLQVLPGGYAQFYSGGTGAGWHQVNHEGAEMAMEAYDLRIRTRWTQ